MLDSNKTLPVLGAIAGALLCLPGTAAADDGLFLSGAALYAYIDEDVDVDDEDQLEAFFDDSSVGYNLGAGWRFNNWLSVDVGYWDFGQFKSDALETGDKLEIDTTAFTAGAMFSVPLFIFDIYARGGAAFWDMDAKRVGDDGTDPYYGVGGALNIFGSLDIYLEWVRFDLDTSLDTANLGVRFTF